MKSLHDATAHPDHSVALSQAFIVGKAGFYVTRTLVGALEGGFWPGAVLFLSDFYTARELAPRLAVLSAMVDVSIICFDPTRELTLV